MRGIWYLGLYRRTKSIKRRPVALVYHVYNLHELLTLNYSNGKQLYMQTYL